jgi:hypothetical protein
MPEIVHNEDFDYYCIKNVPELTIVDTYKNKF